MGLESLTSKKSPASNQPRDRQTDFAAKPFSPTIESPTGLFNPMGSKAQVVATDTQQRQSHISVQRYF